MNEHAEVREVRAKVARAETVKRAFIIVTAFLVAAVLVLVLWTQQTIRGCVDPDGECSKRGQEQTAKAVGDLNRVTILAAACAGELPPGLTVDQRVDLISACITKRLAERPAS